jgi:uncharacterized phiE125 gp8 family phage protein
MKIDAQRVKITTAPATEPVTVAEAKAQSRIDASAEDTLIERYISAARIQCENISARSYVTRTYTAYLDCWPGWVFTLPFPPLAAITSIKYYDDVGGAAATVSSADYIVDINSEPGRVALVSGASWPSVSLRPINGVEIIYTAGYGAAAAVPAIYKQAIVLVAAHYYENRESVVVQQGVGMIQVPQAVEWLLLTDRAY